VDSGEAFRQYRSDAKIAGRQGRVLPALPLAVVFAAHDCNRARFLTFLRKFHTVLPLAFYKFKAKLAQSLTQILKSLQLTLFSRRGLWELFNPFSIVRSAKGGTQLSFNLNYL
jgi:hypothetical protein